MQISTQVPFSMMEAIVKAGKNAADPKNQYLASSGDRLDGGDRIVTLEQAQDLPDRFTLYPLAWEQIEQQIPKGDAWQISGSCMESALINEARRRGFTPLPGIEPKGGTYSGVFKIRLKEGGELWSNPAWVAAGQYGQSVP